MAGNLEVSIIANIADFQEKLRLAQQNLKESTAEMQRWAAEVQASGGANTYAVGRQKEAALAVAEYTGQISLAKQGIAEAIPKMTELAGSTSVMTREFLVLGREAARGNFSRMAGSLSILATQGFGVQTGMLAAAAGVAVLAGGLVYLIDRADKAAIAVQNIKLGAAFEGGVTLSTDQIQKMISEVNKLPQVVGVDAAKVVAAFATMRTTSAPEIEALSLLIKDYAQVTDQSSEKATEALKKAFSDPLKNVVEFVTQFHGATEAQREQALAAQQAGNANAAAALMIETLRAAIASQGAALADLNVKRLDSIRGLLDMDTGALRLAAHERALKENISDDAAATEILNEAREKQVEILQRLTGVMQGLGTAPETAMMTGIEDAAKLDPTLTKIADLKAKIAEFTALLPDATAAAKRSVDAPLDQLTAGLTKAQQELSTLQLGPIIDKARTAIAQLQSTWSGSEAGILAAERNIWAGVAQQTAASTAQHLQAIQEMGRLDVQLRRQASTEVSKVGQEAIQQARDDISAIDANDTLGRQHQLEVARDVWVQLLLGSKLTASERIQVEREFNNSMAALSRQRMSDATTISQDQVKTDIEIRKLSLAAEKSSLDGQVSAHQITADQKLAIERRLVAELAGLDIEELQNEQASLDRQSVEWQKLADQIRVIQAGLSVDLAGLNKKSLDTEAADWQAFSGTVDGAVSTMVSGVLQGTQTIGQAMGRAIGNMLLVWIEALAKMGFQFVAFEIATMSGWTKLAGAIGNPLTSGSGIGGFLGSALGLGSGAAGGVGGAAQAAATTANTAAVTADTAAVTAAAAAQAAGTAATTTLAATTAPEIAALAAEATAVTANTAALLANTAALGASSAAGALGKAASFIPFLAEGASNITAPGLAFLHLGERVTPAAFNRPGATSTRDVSLAGGDTHIQVNFTANGRLSRDEIAANARYIATVVAEQYRLNPRIRPDY